MNREKHLELCLKIIQIKGWKNGHLQPLVDSAIAEQLDWTCTDFKDLEECLKEFKKQKIEFELPIERFTV